MTIAAAIQFFATPFAREHNLATAARLARVAAGQGARLIVLPELFNTGFVYSPRLTQAAEDEAGPSVAWLLEQSAALGVHLGGSLLSRQAGHVHNTFVLATPDGRLNRCFQRHLFLWERCYFEAGREPLIAATALGRLGLLVGGDVAQPAAWAAYAGQVDAILIASAPPRFHRAILNFPGAHKVYLAQLMPALVRARERMDRLYSAHLAACAAAQGVPVVHAAMAGRFVTQLPIPRLSLWGAAWSRPRYWRLAGQAHLASMRATFYGGSAIYDGQGATLAQVDGDEGVALAEITLPSAPHRSGPVPRPRLPAGLRLFDLLLRPLAAWAYRRNRAQ